jgi:hypothetical protein
VLDSSELQDSTLPAHSARTPDKPPKYKRLTHDQLGKALRLHTEGLDDVRIAAVLKCHQSTVNRALAGLGVDTTALAQHRLKASAFPAVERTLAVLEKGKDDVALKAAKLVLEGSGVISTTSTVQLGIQVIIGGESQPAIGAGSVQVEALEATVEPG